MTETHKDMRHANATPEVEQGWSGEELPMISVLCTTYNHGRFIRRCLDGFVMQKTSFPVEFIIHDDASTDDTAEIVMEYALLYPQLIKPILQTENQFSKGNPILEKLICKSRGKYVAFCEGDDYWICAEKLQQQVECLEQFGGASMCFHPVEVFDDDSELTTHLFPEGIYNNCHFGFNDLLSRNIISTCSVCIRRSALPRDLNLGGLIVGDWPLFLICAEVGTLSCLASPMARYRRHSGGIWSHRSHESRLHVIATMWSFLAGKLQYPESRVKAANSAATAYLEIADLSAESGKAEDAWKAFSKYVKYARLVGEDGWGVFLRHGRRLNILRIGTVLSTIECALYLPRRVFRRVARMF